MKEILEKLKKKGKKFLYAYLLCMAIYYLFDGIYMPWLTVKFGIWVFVPLYPSILITNFLGVYLYNYLGEDVMFMEFGSEWINREGGKLECIKKRIRKNEALIFIALSCWPAPIGSYIFFRKDKNESAAAIFKSIAIGSIYCTALWGGLLGIIWLVIVNIIKFF